MEPEILARPAIRNSNGEVVAHAEIVLEPDGTGTIRYPPTLGELDLGTYTVDEAELTVPAARRITYPTG